MNSRSMIVLFLLFVGLFFVMQYYTIMRLFGIFDANFSVGVAFVLMTISYPLAVILDKYLHSVFTRILYFTVGLVYGVIFLLFFVFAILETANIFLAQNIFANNVVVLTSVLFTLLIVAYATFNALHLKVKTVNITNFGKNLKIVQLSDVHIGAIRNSKYLQEIVEKTNALNPDVVVITGDLVDGSGKLRLETYKKLDNLKAPTFMVMGNHEFYEGENRVIKLLSKTNLKILRNDVATIKGINILGVDYTEKNEEIANFLTKSKYDKTKPSILLAHVPIGYNEASNRGIKLQLSGHTHRGQIFPFSLLVKIIYPKSGGLYMIDKMNLYVSAGTGTWGPLMRLGSSNEITEIILHK